VLVVDAGFEVAATDEGVYCALFTLLTYSLLADALFSHCFDARM